MLRKLKTSDKAEALRKVPLFAPCTTAELEEIAGLSSEVAVQEGQVLCSEGSIGHEFFVLTEGSALVSTEAGTSITVGAGDFFGELALLDDGPRTATVTMASDGQVLDMSGTEFRSLLRAAPAIAVRMLPVLAARLRAAGAA
jgi:CRP/FNR family cyclic AMP-dependent transcriptional regulator